MAHLLHRSIESLLTKEDRAYISAIDGDLRERPEFHTVIEPMLSHYGNLVNSILESLPSPSPLTHNNNTHYLLYAFPILSTYLEFHGRILSATQLNDIFTNLEDKLHGKEPGTSLFHTTQTLRHLMHYALTHFKLRLPNITSLSSVTQTHDYDTNHQYPRT